MTTAAPASEAPVPTAVVAPRRGVAVQLQEVWKYRELLANLVRKELKVKYKNSALGFLWSMLNPAMYLVVFYIVFEKILRAGIPSFAVFLLTGLLAWNLLATSLGAATGSIVGNSSLVNKVYFPRHVLPLAGVGANIVHFLLQGLVLVAALFGFGFGIDVGYVWLVVPSVLVLLVLTSALAVFLAGANVYARDTQHLVELALLAWFWMTPIVYPWGLTARQLVDLELPVGLTLLNPMTSIVLGFQRSLYGIVYDSGGQLLIPEASGWWYLRNLAVVGVVSCVLLAVAFKLFGRWEGDFAEEL